MFLPQGRNCGSFSDSNWDRAFFIKKHRRAKNSRHAGHVAQKLASLPETLNSPNFKSQKTLRSALIHYAVYTYQSFILCYYQEI